MDCWPCGVSHTDHEEPDLGDWDRQDIVPKGFQHRDSPPAVLQRSLSRRRYNQLPAVRMRQHHVPEQWVHLLSTLLMRNSRSWPTLGQAVEAFSDLFAKNGLP